MPVIETRLDPRQAMVACLAHPGQVISAIIPARRIGGRV